MTRSTTDDDFVAWLAALNPESVASVRFPLQRLLDGSLYYPASAFDGDPIRLLGGVVQSFVYVDYCKSAEDLDREVRERGFKGYQVIARREVGEQELVPSGWRPVDPNPSDGDPHLYHDEMAPAFCTWYIFGRHQELSDTHGPERFSLLFLCADGVAAFHSLYVSNGLKPRVLAVIQPGTGFGFNWTAFEDPMKIFARTVLGNPAGSPDELLFGGIGSRNFYLRPCWPQYGRHLMSFRKSGGGTIGRWARS